MYLRAQTNSKWHVTLRHYMRFKALPLPKPIGFSKVQANQEQRKQNIK